MRVIAGKAKGKKLKSPQGNTRPLTDRVREALFNILQTRVADCHFLDLFAGTGSVGLEALSREAQAATFVELDRKTISVLRQNIETCGFKESAEVYAVDVIRGLKILHKNGAQFDIIFIGAPYDSPNLIKVFEYLGQNELIAERGIVIAEHRKQHQIEVQYGGLKQFRSVKYGETELTFYESGNLSR